jgi:hypothetical protein
MSLGVTDLPVETEYVWTVAELFEEFLEVPGALVLCVVVVVDAGETVLDVQLGRHAHAILGGQLHRAAHLLQR